MADTPKRRGRPRILNTSQERLAELTNREKALAQKARARTTYHITFTLDEYEALVSEAEKWGETVATVIRAAIKKGLEHYNRFHGASTSPYVDGDLTPRPQHRIDPTGEVFPPTTPTVWGGRPNIPVGPGLLPSGATLNLGSTERADSPPSGVPAQAMIVDEG